MATNKMIPRRLVSDTDEKLLKPTDMVDALNITVSEDGEGTGGVVKNARGNSGVYYESDTDTFTVGQPDLVPGAKVIGQVADPARGFIYFFVRGGQGDRNADGIYQYSKDTGQYTEVYRGTDLLNFGVENNITANVVNGQFSQNDELETMLYFTGDSMINPPRKINIDRAIAGEYYFRVGLSDDANDVLLTVARPPIGLCPTITFETDLDLDTNNFVKTTFQFATQLVFKDGEVSAISPYSKLAYPDNIASSGLEDDGDGLLPITDNVCVINTRYVPGQASSRYIPHIKYIRILGRDGNSEEMFVVDEFDPNQDITRKVFGSDKQVYASSTGIYRFYNDSAYKSVPAEDVLKMYDNVPKVAMGQTIAGNRLTYSYYKEGYDNVDATATLAPVYADANSDSEIIDESEAASIITAHTGYGAVDIDMLSASEFSAISDVIEDGTSIRLSFDLNIPNSLNIYDTTPPMLYGYIEDTVAEYQYYGFIGGSGATAISPAATANDKITVEVNLASPLSETIDNLIDRIVDEINQQNITKEFSYSPDPTWTFEVEAFSPSIPSPKFAVGEQVPFVGTIDITWEIVAERTANTIRLYPVIRKVESVSVKEQTGAVGSIGGNTVAGSLIWNSTNKGWNTSAIQAAVDLGGTVTYNGIPWENNAPDNAAPWTATHTSGLAGTSGNPTEKFISMVSFSATPSFKSGSSHEIGVVYFDEFNRSGFVNKLGSFYAQRPQERAGGEGKAATFCQTQITSTAPSWAKTFQFVYPGAGSYSSVFTYTTGTARTPYNKQTWDAAASPNVSTHFEADENNKRVYVNIDTIENFKNKKGAVIDYSFTPGDILRVVSYEDTSGTTYFPSAASGGAIEFRVVDDVTLGDTDNPLYPTINNEVPAKYKGRWLVLDAPSVAAGLAYNTSGDDEQYNEWDWYSVTNAFFNGTNSVNYTGTYPDGTTPPTNTRWGHRSVIEVLTPRGGASDRIWYEIGETHDIGQHGGTFTLVGDVYHRAVTCNGPEYDTTSVPNAWTTGEASESWGFSTIAIETPYISDYILESSKAWSRGRSHVEAKNEGERFYRSSVVYSEEYQDDIVDLRLSSFNPTKANFYNFDKKYGSLYSIQDYNDRLLGIQQDRVSFTTVNKNLLSYADGSGSVSVSENPFGSTLYAEVDAGLSDPFIGSVLNTGGEVYFADYDKEKIVKISGNGLSFISDLGLRSEFEDEFRRYKDTGTKQNIVSGYDPRDGVVFFTFNTVANSKTYGYTESTGFWTSRFSFIPERYAYIDNRLFTFKYDSAISSTQDLIMWEHTDTADRCNYYTTQYDSSVTVVSNQAPSNVKVFDAISLETDSDNWVSPSGGVTTELGCSGRVRSFTDKEGVRYSAFGRDEATNIASAIPLGELAENLPSSITAPTTMTSKLDRLPIKTGMSIRKLVGGELEHIATTPASPTISSWNGTTLTLNTFFGTTVTPSGTPLYAVLDENEVNGSPIRGAWAKIKLDNNSTTKYELYSINTYTSDSPYHYG